MSNVLAASEQPFQRVYKLTAQVKMLIPQFVIQTEKFRTALNTNDYKTIKEIHDWYTSITNMGIPSDNWEYLAEKVTYDLGTLFYKELKMKNGH